eukprot:5998903-Pyramimonas_sp.AAC.1
MLEVPRLSVLGHFKGMACLGVPQLSECEWSDLLSSSRRADPRRGGLAASISPPQCARLFELLVLWEVWGHC